MAAISRRAERSTNIWPGFVDALATLLMVIIFLLMVFVLAQFFLSEALTGRDAALDRLNRQVAELAETLALERRANADLRTNLEQVSSELQASVAARDDLSAQIQALTLRAESAEEEAEKVKADLEDAFKSILADRQKIELQLRQVAALSRDIEALTALRAELEQQIKDLAGKLEGSEGRLVEEKRLLIEEKKLSESARAQVALLNQQIKELRLQIGRLTEALDISEKTAQEQQVQIANLGKRLNAALASKVQQLSRYRSEFFGRLREVLGGQRGIRIVGDRFVFQSEVLFTTGSAELGVAGQDQISQLATTLRDISGRIPENIDWVLRIDGHTDRVPIRTPQFPSNWELSTARAISVVKFLIDAGIPANRLAATGFGEFQPIDARDDEIAYRRNRRIEFKLTQR